MHFLVAFFLALLLVVALRPFGHKFGIYDIPNQRKNHNRPVLVIGGIAMVLALKASMHLLGPVPQPVSYLMLALAVTCVVGLVDDLYHLSSRSLFSTQILAAIIVIWLGGTEVQNLGNLFGFGVIHTGHMAMVFTLICTLGVINAVNMSDGVDGLAGFMVLISTCWFAVLAYLTNMQMLFDISLMLMGVVLGFLAFNMRHPWRKQASIFMGNAGSLSLGLLMTWFAVELSGKLGSPVTPITAVWVIAMPLLDMTRVMVSRIRQGKSPFVADHQHLHHILSSVGYSVEHVVAIKGVVSFLMGAVGVGAWYIGVPEWVMFYSFIATVGLYFYLLGSGWRHVCHKIERRRAESRS